MLKITKQEFENYSKQFLSVFDRILKAEAENLSDQAKEKELKLVSLLLNQIEAGNIFALYGSCRTAEELLKEDFSAVKKRVKEHIIARGYYNPASPLTLAEFRERKKKRGWEDFKKLWKDKEQSYKLLGEMSEENRTYISHAFNFFEKSDEIFPEEERKKLTEETWKDAGFIWEDVLKVFEEAHKRLEERERERDNPTILPLSLTLTNKIMIR